MLFNGDGVPRDWVRAYALLQRSSAAGLPQGSQTLAEMDRYIPEAQRQQGIALARQYEAQAGRPNYPSEIAGGGPAQPGISPIDVPPSTGPGAPYPPPGSKPPKGKSPVLVTADPPGTRYVPRPPMAPPSPPQPVSRPAAQPRPAAVETGGGWRVQLGAFGDPNNARKLWSQVGGRFSGRQASFVKSGALTRLLVGPYRSKAEAAGACGAVKPCVPVAP